MVKFTEEQQKYILKFAKTKGTRRIARDLGVSREEVTYFIEKNAHGAPVKQAIPEGWNRALYIFLPAAVLFFTVLLCFFRLIARNAEGNLTHIIKWDVVDYTYPLLLYISDSITNFIFPLWNPYQYCGIPCALNPGTIAYNPMCLFVILFRGYSLELLQLHTFFVFFAAGLSMYLCLRSFSLSKTAALIGGISYMSCGFFVAGAEYFTLINMLAFLPICLMLLNRLLNLPDLRNLSLGALSIAILAFFGHPTMLVSFIYLLFLFGLLKIFFVDRSTERPLVFKKSFYFAGFFTLGILSASILLLPGAELAGLSTRSGGVSLEIIKIDSLPLCHLGSMWYPFLALKDFPSAPLDIALRNCSIGILGLFFAIYFFLFNKERLKWSILIIFLGSLMMSFGDNLPTYKLVIKMVPLIKHFRHPAVDYRAIFLFLLCFSAGFGVQEMRKCTADCLKKSLIACAAVLGLGIVMYMYIKGAFNVDVLAMTVKNYPFLLISILFLLTAAGMALNVSKKWFCAMLILFCMIDVGHWAEVNFFTVAVPVDNKVWVNIKGMESHRNFKVDENASFIRQRGGYPISLKDNFGMVNKSFSDTGYEPLILKYYDEFIKSRASEIVAEDFRALPIYEARILPDDQKVLSDINNGTDLHKTALINKRDIKDAALLDKIGRLSFTGSNGFSSRITHYAPNSIDYQIDLAVPAIIFFNEIYYPGWHLSSDGKEMPLFKVNHAFRGTYLEAGSHRLKMTFFPLSFKIGLIVSACCFTFIFFNILFRRKNKTSNT